VPAPIVVLDTSKLSPEEPAQEILRHLELRPAALALASALVLGLIVVALFAWSRATVPPADGGAGEAGTPGRSADPAVAAISGVPYVAGVRDPATRRGGVLHHEPALASPGWNLYSPRYRPEAYLLANDGRVAHRWRLESGPWQHVEPLPGGGLLALVKFAELVRLDAASRVLWRVPGRFHHNAAVDAQGRIHALVQRLEERPEIHPELPVLVDRVEVLSPEGERLGELSLLDLLAGSPHASRVPTVADAEPGKDLPGIDLLHANWIEVLDGRLADRSPLFAAGNYLVSLRTPSLILIADPAARAILWAWGGPPALTFQHHPTLTDEGRILVFDNGLEQSRVLEIDPLEDQVAWRYEAPDLLSRTRGAVQRLPNGNTLVTESDTGYAFEVTRAGNRVWTFANPAFTEAGERMAVWKVARLPPGDPRLPPGL